MGGAGLKVLQVRDPLLAIVQAGAESKVSRRLIDLGDHLRQRPAPGQVTPARQAREKIFQRRGQVVVPLLGIANDRVVKRNRFIAFDRIREGAPGDAVFGLGKIGQRASRSNRRQRDILALVFQQRQ